KFFHRSEIPDGLLFTETAFHLHLNMLGILRQNILLLFILQNLQICTQFIKKFLSIHLLLHSASAGMQKLCLSAAAIPSPGNPGTECRRQSDDNISAAA